MIFCYPACNLYADTVTSGSIGLLKPTTGIIDVKRNWLDKLNSNFDTIASTITATILTGNNSNYATVSNFDLLNTRVNTSTASLTIKPVPYSIIIGTSNTGTNNNVNIATNTEQAFSIAFTSLGANGGTIFVRRGFYSVRGVTVPSNVEIIFESSAVVRNRGNFKVFDSSGIIRQLQFETDASVTVPMIKLNSNARLYDTMNILIINAAIDGTGEGIYEISNADNVLIDGMINKIWINNVTPAGLNSVNSRYFIARSSNIVFNNIQDTVIERTGTGAQMSDFSAQFKLIERAGNITIKNSKFIVSGIFISDDGNGGTLSENLSVLNNEMEIVEHRGVGQIMPFGGTSSNTVINNLIVYFSSVSSTLDYFSNMTINIDHSIWKDVTMRRNSSASGNSMNTFLQVDSGSVGHRVYNCDIGAGGANFLAGAGAVKRGDNNYLNGAAQTDDD